MTGDFAEAPHEGVVAPLDEARASIEGLEGSDEVRYAGYPSSGDRQVVVVRDGKVVASFALVTFDGEGWIAAGATGVRRNRYPIRTRLVDRAERSDGADAPGYLEQHVRVLLRVDHQPSGYADVRLPVRVDPVDRPASCLRAAEASDHLAAGPDRLGAHEESAVPAVDRPPECADRSPPAVVLFTRDEQVTDGTVREQVRGRQDRRGRSPAASPRCGLGACLVPKKLPPCTANCSPPCGALHRTDGRFGTGPWT